MSNKRKKLEKKAEELNLSFVPETTDEELEQLIADFGADVDNDADTKYYRSKLLPGLSIQIGDEPGRQEQPTEVRFTPYAEKDEKTGDTNRVGYLATDEPDAQEILTDDANVEEISKEEFEQATENGTRARL